MPREFGHHVLQDGPVWPEASELTVEQVVRLMLHANGPPPGVDGMPYEALHAGIPFCAHLMCAALGELHSPGGHVDGLLGDALELVVYIQKKGSDRVSLQRLLRLPSCWRRHVGACLAEAMAPGATRTVQPHHVALSGPECIPAVAEATRRLAPAPRPAPAAPRLAAPAPAYTLKLPV